MMDEYPIGGNQPQARTSFHLLFEFCSRVAIRKPASPAESRAACNGQDSDAPESSGAKAFARLCEGLTDVTWLHCFQNRRHRRFLGRYRRVHGMEREMRLFLFFFGL
jgi:hypothetical protein